MRKKSEPAVAPVPRMNYRALMRHEDLGRAREPPENLVCTEHPECAGCPYLAHGFMCWPGDCIRKRMERIQRGGKQDESQNLSDQLGS